MNCEQAFQQLTSTSPSLENDSLQQHLNGCASCRQMAELFRPAVEILGNGSQEGPWSHSDSWQRVWDAAAIAERSAAQLRDALAVEPQQSGVWSWVRSTALLAAGVVFGVCLNGSGIIGANHANGQPPQTLAIGRSVDSDPDCRCARLVSHTRHANEMGVCILCQGRPRKMNVKSLCMVCHETVAPAAAGESTRDKLQGSWQPLRHPPLGSTQPMARLLVDAWLNAGIARAQQAG
jgi:hypothetical protein